MKYIGIDNGTSGSIAIIDDNGDAKYFKTPAFDFTHYTKEVKIIKRIDINRLRGILDECASVPCKCFIERPFTGKNTNTMLLSARSYEATLIILEELKIPYETVDSKEWQKAMLPSGIWHTVTTKTGRTIYKADPKKLKQASKDTAKRLFPRTEITGDGDSLLIAEYRRKKEQGKEADNGR